MVTNATSFSRSGLSDFIIQRLTAVVLGAYALCVLAFFVGHPGLDYAALTGFFGNFSMKIFSTAAVLSTVAHAWIGLWTVGTDYLLPGHLGKSATSIRFIYQMGCFLILFVYLVWAIQLFWSL
ncbi:MAG: succinate dehydrogenase, hydrophobic membrane anchor protein [Pseudomonadales bacterium]|nr:succinate dehydrogenase, hydrophobic membrane anchor protein [Pseudomonadales bacterium]MCP5183938.1 succinate dehydrogenase, hydrophobic membrane anchor protein [Pseudomonadales bacterium]